MRKAHIKVMQAIYASVPKEYTENLMVEVDMYKETKEILRKAIGDPGVPEEQKKRYKNLLLSGHLDVVETVENEDIQNKIQAYIEGEIVKAVKEKRLPKTTFKELMKKGRKYDKIQQGSEA